MRPEEYAGLGLIQTRISYFSIWPPRAAVGEPVYVKGRLEWHDPLCWWRPVGDRKVELWVDGVKEAEKWVSGDGSFSFTLVFQSPGTYRVKAVFPGDWLLSGSESPEYTVVVVSQEQKILETLLLAGLALAGIGAFIYFAARK